MMRCVMGAAPLHAASLRAVSLIYLQLLYDCKGTLAAIENLPSDTSGDAVRNKFLNDGRLDYRTMESLYREGRLQDAEFVHRTAMGVAHVPPLNATVPTSTAMDDRTDPVHVVEARLDYVLLSKSLADRVVSCRTLHVRER